MREITGYEYEQYCCRYLKRLGYKRVTQTKKSGDHGVDIIAVRRRKRYAFQCKYYGKKVGNKAVQEAYTGCSYYECDIPVVITNNEFTRNAIEEAKTLEVVLMDNVQYKRRSVWPLVFLIALIAALGIYDSLLAFAVVVISLIIYALAVIWLNRFQE